MSPEELKKIALESSRKEYETIVAEMKKAAQQGSFSCDFSDISDGAIEQLRKDGFSVVPKTTYNKGIRTSSTTYYQVSFDKK